MQTDNYKVKGLLAMQLDKVYSASTDNCHDSYTYDLVLSLNKRQEDFILALKKIQINIVSHTSLPAFGIGLVRRQPETTCSPSGQQSQEDHDMTIQQTNKKQKLVVV